MYMFYVLSIFITQFLYFFASAIFFLRKICFFFWLFPISITYKKIIINIKVCEVYLLFFCCASTQSQTLCACVLHAMQNEVARALLLTHTLSATSFSFPRILFSMVWLVLSCLGLLSFALFCLDFLFI